MRVPKILIVGGYGIVGEQVATLLDERNPSLEIWIGGRAVDKAAVVAARLPNARAVHIDLDNSDPLSYFVELPDAIIVLANDDHDYLLVAAARRGIALIDIARWTERMRRAIDVLSSIPLTAPIIMASGWMAGVPATIAAQLATKLSTIDNINIDVLYALNDKAGPNSIAYADQLDTAFSIQSAGQTRIVKPLTEPRLVEFSGKRNFNCYRFDTPDQFTLVTTLNAAGVSSRITYDDVSTVKLMRFLRWSGLLSLLSMEIFKKLRHTLLFHPGEGGTHEIIVEVVGTAPSGQSVTHRVTIIDPLGQTHLTAVGVVAQIERVLTLRGRAPAFPGISFPEQLTDTDEALAVLREMGVLIKCHIDLN